MKHVALVLAVLTALVGMTGSTEAQGPPAPLTPKPWHLEVTPFGWFAGLNADVTVGERSTEIDLPFSDILDAVSFAGSFMVDADYNKHLLYLNGSFFSLDTDNLDDDDSPDGGNLESDIVIFSAGVGHRFPGITEHSNVDVLVGVQTFNIENTLTLNNLGEFMSENNVTDFMVTIRPSMWLHKRVRFNSTIGLGGGDSDFTFDASPQLQIFITENIATRIGFRKIDWNIEEDEREFDGGLKGLMLGVGGCW